MKKQYFIFMICSLLLIGCSANNSAKDLSKVADSFKYYDYLKDKDGELLKKWK